MQAEAQRQPPAESRGQRSFRGVDQQAAALEGQESLLSAFHAQLDCELVLGPRLFGFQAHDAIRG